MSAMLGPLEPEVDNPTVGKRMLDFTGFMDASEFEETQAPFPACFIAKACGLHFKVKEHRRFSWNCRCFFAVEQRRKFEMKIIPVLLNVLLVAVLLPVCALAEEMGLSQASSMAAIAVLAVAMIIGLYFSARRVKWNAAMIAKAAICVALAYILSMIKIFRMPMGGSVTLVAMYPLILFAVAFGPLEGMLIGCVYGLLQLMIDPYVIHPLQLLVDYPMAYAALALACVSAKLPMHDRLKLPAAVLLGYLGRYALAVLSGVVFFAEYAGEQNALIYSLVYNVGYLGPEALVCMVVAAIPGMNRLPAMLKHNAMH